MILLTGACGMLGRSLVSALTKQKLDFASISRSTLDISNRSSVEQVISSYRPKAVINCAAATDVDWCESNEKQATLINGEGVQHLASACSRRGTRLIHIGTDYVFDGKKQRPYTEKDEVNPLQAYGRSKLIGEQYAEMWGGIVLRVQWLYGAARLNFVDRVVQAGLNQREISIVADQAGSLCSTDWLAEMIIRAVKGIEKSGIYHLSHDDSATRYESAEYILQLIGADTRLLKKVEKGFFSAQRPVSTILDCSRLKTALGLGSLSSWKTDVATYIGERYKDDYIRKECDRVHKDTD